MSQAKDRELLRRLELISRIKPSAESTDRAMTKTRQALLDAANAPASRPEPRIIRLLSFNTGIKVAIAAVIVAAFSTGIVLWNNAPGPHSEPYAIKAPDESPLPADIPLIDRLQYESKHIGDMVAQRDTQGMINLMETALPASRLAIAGHLQQWGNETAIPALQRYAQSWTGYADNPYAKAITQIQQRLAQSDTDEIETPSLIESDDTDLESMVAASTTTQQAASMGLKGYVTDRQTGQPIADAQLSIAGPSTYTTQTDTKGFYYVDTISDSGPYRIKVTAQGYLGLDSPSTMGFVSLAQDSRMVKNFQLEKGCLIHVLATDEIGQPIPDARLTASWLGLDHDNDMGAPVTTDTEGQATVGPVKISDIAYKISAIHDEYVPQYETVQCISPDVYPSVLVILPQGQAVQGYAEYSDGVPAQGVEIVARPNWWHSMTLLKGHRVDELGNFTLTSVEPETYRLFARFLQPDGSINETEVTQVELPPLDNELLTVTLPRTSPQPTVSIGGTLLWADEKRPDFVDIIAYSPDIQTENMISRIQLKNDLDRFEIAGLIPGQYHLYFEGSNVQPVLIEDVKAPLNDLEVALTYISTPLLSGSVVRADTGEGVNDFTLTLLKKRSLPGSLYLSDRQWNRFVDANGLFNIQQLGPGTYDIQINADGYVPVTIEHTITGDDRPLYIELSEGGSLMGHVIDLQGQPIIGAVVAVTSSNPVNPLTIKTQTQNGDFLLEHISLGLHTIKITHPDHGSIVIDDIDVVEGFIFDLGHITLFTGATIEGIVLDNSGLPVPNSTLTVEDNSGQILTSAMTDEFGFYKTMGLPANQYLISLSHPDPNVGFLQYPLSIEQDKRYQLDFTVDPRVIINVQIIGMDERPLMSATVWLEDAENVRHKPLLGTETELIFIADAGSYTLHVEHDGFRSETRAITIEPNNQTSFNPERPVIKIQLQPN